jgi:predicted pyridoxine 5'-phosphate oxidase superfamily flavin-nucleotide-binding protein
MAKKGYIRLTDRRRTKENRMGRKIPDNVIKFLSGKIGWVGTASKEGMPNIALKGSLKLLDDEHLLFADLFSKKTRKNLEENPRVAVMVIDMDTLGGYLFKGKAELFSSGPLYDAVSQELKSSPKHLPVPTYIVRITVESIYDQSLGPNSGNEVP